MTSTTALTMSVPKKKKFGQNLNKLMAPDEQDEKKRASQEQGGMLLLSSNKKNSHESSLLSSSSGGGGLGGKAPDAWGVKQAPEQAAPTPKKNQPAAKPTVPKRDPNLDKSEAPKVPTKDAPAWDDYGGRGPQPSNSNSKLFMETMSDSMGQRARQKASQIQTAEATRVAAQRERANTRLAELEAKVVPPRQKTTSLWEPPAVTRKTNNDYDRGASITKIQLNSYEDRSRGEVKPSAPRMLYDPKSGGMVAVKEPKKRRERKPKNKTAASQKPKRGAKSNKESTALNELPKKQCKKNSPKNGNRSTKGRSRGLRSGKHNKVDIDTTVAATNNRKVSLYTGFDPETSTTGIRNEPVVFEVMKADDKMELLTGEESPTLKPTAKIFAPSQAALAAIASAPDQSDFVDDADDASDDDGLGFDPTQDMDGLMQMENLHDDLDLDALGLESKDSPVDDNAAAPRHIFAFGSSGTWGDTQATTNNDTWSGLFGVKEETSQLWGKNGADEFGGLGGGGDQTTGDG